MVVSVPTSTAAVAAVAMVAVPTSATAITVTVVSTATIAASIATTDSTVTTAAAIVAALACARTTRASTAGVRTAAASLHVATPAAPADLLTGARSGLPGMLRTRSVNDHRIRLFTQRVIHEFGLGMERRVGAQREAGAHLRR